MTELFGAVAALLFATAILRQVDLPRAVRLPLAALTGLALFSAGWLAVVLWGGARPWLHVARDAALFAAGLLLLRIPAVQAHTPPAGTRCALAKRAFGLACAVAAACFIARAIRTPDGGEDAWSIWNLRARWLFRAPDPTTAFSPELSPWTQLDYPLLLPGAVARSFRMAGTETPIAPQAIAALAALASVAILVSSVSALRGAGAAWLAGMALVTTPCFVILAADQLADVPMSAFVVAAASAIALRRGEDRRTLVLSGALASAAAFTKNEGALYLVLLLACIAATEVRRRGWRAAGAAAASFLGGAAPLLILLAAFKLGLAPPSSMVVGAWRSSPVARLLDPVKWRILLGAALRRIVFVQSWGVHLVVLIALLVAFRRAAPTAPSGTAAISWFPGIALASLGLVYLVQPHDLSWIVPLSIDRLLIQLWPAILLVAFTRSVRYEHGQGTGG